MLICTRSVDNLWKCTRCIVLQQLQHFEKKKKSKEKKNRRGGKNKKAEYGHKAYLYTTWRYLTFQFDLNDTWLSREVQKEQVCVSPLRRITNWGVPDRGPGPNSTSEVDYINISSPFREPDSAVMRLSAK